MNTSRVRGFLVPSIVLLLALLACNYPTQSQVYNSATATMQALGTRVAEAELAQSGVESAESAATPASDAGSEPATETPAPPTPTPTPSETPTPTPCVPRVSVSTNTNCRSGPGQAYDYLGALLTGEEAEIVGQSTVPNYFVIDNPDNPGQDCWLWGQYAEVVCDTSDLPMMTPPPTPTPTYPDWSGSWTTWCDALSPNPISLYINQSDDHLWGEYSYGGDTYSFTADLSGDGMGADGNRYKPGNSLERGWLFWTMFENRNQFKGSVGGNWGEWCGARGGASKPSPCANY